MQRLGPPHWPAYPPGARYGALYDRDPEAGLAAARLGARLIAADLRRARHRRRLPAARRRAGRRAATRSSATAPMAANPARSPPSPPPSREGLTAGGVLPVLKHLPGHGRATRRQPPQAAGGRHRPRHAGSDRFCRLPPARRPAARHDRACCVYRHRPGRTGHNFGHNGARSDSRVHRVPRAADERRHLDGRPVRHARRAQPRRARGRLRCRASLQRRARAKCARSPASCRSLRARRCARADAALAARSAPEEFDVEAARKCSRRWSRANCRERRMSV